MRIFVAVVIVIFLIGCTSNNSIDKMNNDTNDLTAFHEDKYFDAIYSQSL